ncbi:MAG: tetratricopeptide repeat protein [Acidobacteria bacterium]|nr:tetratricopeptide repeat protein [Acidobacteriota bacterium]
MRVALLLILFAATLVRAQQGEPDRLIREALLAQQLGDYKTAILDYQRYLKLHPKMVEARANLGAALAHEGRFDEAISEYREALVSAPGNDQIEMNLGLAYYKKGDFADARRVFGEVQKAAPDNSQIAILLGNSEVRLGQGAAAVKMLMPLEAANANNTDFEYVLGSALVQTGDQRAGVERLEKVAEATHDPDAYLLAGYTLLNLHKFTSAKADLEKALTLNPNLPRIYALTGMALDQTGDAAAAEPDFREQLKHTPEDFESNLYLGSILYKKREMDEAKIYLDKAVNLDPTSQMAKYEMAMWESTQGQYADAAANLETVVKAIPDWLEPHVELATVYYKLHRPTEGAQERAIVAKIKALQQSEGPPTP